MVKQVPAFEADDGSIHPTWQDAAKQDARIQLKKLDIFNEGSILAVINHAEAVYEALGPLVNRPAETLAVEPQSESR